MTDTVASHKADASQVYRCLVITVSDTRTEKTDRGGALAAQLVQDAGHQVIGRQIVPDEPQRMQGLVAQQSPDDLDAILLTGGTGISPRDQTYETISALIEKPLPGYGELFRWLSYQEIGAGAMLSRAVAGIHRGMLVATMPGSPAAVKLALEQLLLPELGHLIQQARKVPE